MSGSVFFISLSFLRQALLGGAQKNPQACLMEKYLLFLILVVTFVTELRYFMGQGDMMTYHVPSGSIEKGIP